MQTSALLLWSVVLNILSYLAFLFNKKLSKAKAFSGILTKASHDQIKQGSQPTWKSGKSVNYQGV